VDALGVEVGYRAQLFNLGLALVDACAGKGPEIHVRLTEARFHGAADDAVDVGHRAIRGDRADVDLVSGDGVADQTADWDSSAAGATCADAKKLLLGEALGDLMG
jgi:hypothetical protein